MVAIYVDGNMVVSHYIVMQTKGGDSKSDHRLVSIQWSWLFGYAVQEASQVSIHEKSFHLQEKNEQVDFLQEMYNLAAQITTL